MEQSGKFEHAFAVTELLTFLDVVMLLYFVK